MKKVAMLCRAKAYVALHSMATFFCSLEKKNVVGSRKTCEKLREKTSYTLRAFWSTFPFLFLFAQNFRSNSKSYLLEDLRGAHFCKVPFVAAQFSLHMLISKSSSASFGGSSFCTSGARKLECLGLPKLKCTVRVEFQVFLTEIY